MGNGVMFSGYRQQGAINKRLKIGLFIFAGVFITIWAIISSSFSSDTKRIGQGKPVIAMIYEGGDSASVNLRYGYKKLRAEYEDSIEFLLINIHSPNGLHFLQDTDAKAGTALYYDAKGKQLLVMEGPKDVATLGESIKTTFGL